MKNTVYTQKLSSEATTLLFYKSGLGQNLKTQFRNFSTKHAILLSISLFLLNYSSFGQTATCNPANLELAGVAGTYPTGNGPTVAAQTFTFSNNANNPTDNVMSTYTPTTTVTFSLSNQQFNAMAGLSAPQTGMTFGRTFNAASAITRGQSAVNSAAGSNYTSSNYATGVGITGTNTVTATTNVGAWLMINDGNGLPGTNQRPYYGDLTLTFNNPVDNPILHFNDFGGITNTRQFTSEYEMASGYTMTKLSGGANTNVTGNTITSTPQSLESASFRINGNGITSITFKVYMKTNATTAWPTGTGGEAIVIGVSIPTNVPLAPVLATATPTYSCPNTTANITGLQPTPVAGTTLEWHNVATNPTSASLQTGSAVGAGTYYLYAKDNLTGCYSLASTPVVVNASNLDCADCDTDGVPNYIDIDDDNDGILDVIECTPIVSINTFSESFESYATAADMVANMDAVAIYKNIASGYTFIGTGAPGEGTKSIFYGTGAGTYTSGMEVWGTTTPNQPTILPNTDYELGYWEFGTAVGLELYANNVKVGSTVVGTGATWKKHTFIWNSGSATSLDLSIRSLSTISSGNDFALDGISVNKLSCPDTDGDGKPNSCDTDSDGDGCPDAVEAGTTTIKTQSTFAGPYGANGLANSIETNDTQTATVANVPSYSLSNYTANALDNTINVCTDDCDNDGIPNFYDVDDDNDGILDIVECKPATNAVANGDFATNQSPPITSWTTYAGTGWTSSSVHGGSNSTDVLVADSLAQTVSLCGLPTNDLVVEFDIKLRNGQPAGASVQFNLSWNNVPYFNIITADGNNTTYTLTTPNGASAVVSGPIPFSTVTTPPTTYSHVTLTIPVTQNQYQPLAGRLAFALKTLSTGVADDVFIDNVVINEQCCDADSDGIPNQCDTDSDGDGCPDALEAGTTTNKTQSTFAGPYGANGLANSIETNDTQTATTTNVPNYSATIYTDNALNNTVNICDDCDNDDVPNTYDLDDDNDGVLDKAEMNCGLTGTWTGSAGVYEAFIQPDLKVRVSFTGTTWSGITPIANFARNCLDATYLSDYEPLSNTGKPGLQFNVNGGSVGATFKVEYLNAANQPVTVNNPRMHLGGLGGSYGTGTIGSSDWTLTGGDTQTLLANDATDFGATSTTIFHPRLFGPGSGVGDCATGEGSGTLQINGPQSSYSYSVDMNGNTFDQMIVLFEGCAEMDTDNDGKSNSCDTDSDGDGCPDAVEAGTTTIKTQSTFAGSYGANGLADNIETNDTQTATTTNVPYYSAINYTNNALINTVNICVDDCDNDGIPNVYDIDDDNDGVLDVVECPAARPYKVYTYNRVAAAPGLPTNVPVTITGQSTQNYVLNQTVAGTDLTYNGVNWKLMASNVTSDAAQKITVSFNPTAATNGNFLLADAMLITDGVNTFVVDNKDVGFTQTGYTLQNFGANYLAGEHFSSAPHTNKVATWTFSNIPNPASACDPDGDGKINTCDLDSDGDGCSDAFEAGATTEKTANYTFAGAVGANGLANSIETNDTQTAGVNFNPTYSFATNALYNACNAPQCTSEKLTAAQMATIPAGSATYTYPSFGNTNILTISRTAGTQTMGNIPSGTLQGIHLGAGIPNNKFEDYSMEYANCVASMSLSFRAINNNVDGREEIQDFKVFDCNGADITSSVSFAYLDKSVAPHPIGVSAPYTYFDQSTRTIKGTQGTTCSSQTPGGDTGAGGSCCDDGGMLTIVSSIPFKKITYRREGRQSVLPSCSGLSNSNGVTLSDSITWCTVCVKPVVGNDTTVCAGTTFNITGKSPSTGTWTAQTGNPAGATLGTTTGGIANVAFNTTASGSYNFIYTSASCSDTVKVTVTPLPAAPTNPLASQASICVGQSSTLTATCATGTLSWYSNAALTTAVTSPVSPTVTTTYYAACVNGTCKSPSANVVVIVEPIPTVPTNATASPASICVGQSSVLSATCVSPAVATWYTNVGLTTPLVSTTVSPTATTKYYVTCKNTTVSCESVASTVTVTVNPLPAAPTSATPNTPTICGTGNVTLSAVCAAGTVPYWYTDAAGTSAPLAIGTTNTGSVILAISTTTTYYAFCKNTTTLCQSDAAFPVTVTVTPKPTAPTNPLASPPSICSGDASVLSATCASGSPIWYQNSNFTSPLASPTVTPVATTTYYVRCEGNGCVSDLGSQVTVTVTATPVAATNVSAAPATICAGGSSVLNATCTSGTVAWYTNAGLTTALPSTTVTPTVTKTYYVRCENNGCFGPVSSQIVTVNPTPATPTITPLATTICSASSTDLTASGCTGTVNWFVQGNTASIGTGNALTVSPAATTIYEANCTIGTCPSPNSSPATVTVVAAPASPSISVSDNAICAGGSVTLTAQSCSGTLIWFKDGNTIGSGLTLNDTPTANAVYTATCNGNGAVSCSTPANASLNVAVNPLPTAPTVAPTTPTICSGSSTSLTATGCAAAETVNWSNGQTGSSISVSPVVTTSYTAKCVNTTTGCESVLSSPATVTVNQTPTAAPTGTATPTTICSGTSATLTAGACSIGSPIWYTDAGLTTILPSTTVSPTVTTSYFVACVNNGCKGPSEEVIVTVTATPTQPTAVSASLPTICSGGSSTLTATCSVGTPIWYTNIGLTTTLASTTVSPTITTTYAVICNNNGCKSPASTATVTVNPTPLSPTGVSASPPAICSGKSSTLSATCSVGSPVWYSNAGLTAQLPSNTVTPTATTTYYVRCENNGCFGPSEPITVSVTATPNSPATAAAMPNPLCLGSNAVLSATCSTGTLKWYSDAAMMTVQAATTVSPTVNTNYYAVCDLNGCVSTPTTVSLVVKNCAKTDTTTVTPACPTCPTPPICATGDDLPSTGTATYQNCGLTPAQSTQGTLTTDVNGCVIWKPNGMQKDTIKTCVIKCIGAICDTTYIVIPPPIEPDTTIVTPSCPTCPTPPICATADDITVNSSTTYSMCPVTPSGQGTATLDANKCLIFTPNGSQIDTVKTCIVACTNGKCDTTYIVIPPALELPKIAIVKGSALNLGTDGVASVGDIITYSYDVTNIGNVPLTGVSVVESATSFSGTGTLPSPTFVSASAGSSATNLLVAGEAIFTATYAITAADIAAGKVDNSAFANGLSPKNVAVRDTSDSKNPNDYNETGTPSDPNGEDKTGTPIAENPKIAIVKGSSLNLGADNVATVGDIITYSYDVINTGNVPLTGVSVVESATSFSGTGTLPSPTFVSASAGSSATNLLVDGSAVFTATYAITTADIAAGKVDNSAFANGLSPKNVAVRDTSDSKNPNDYNETGTPSDPNGEDKTGTPIAENPKIAIVKGSALNLGTDGVASVGDIITYSYDVSNIGNVPLTGVSVVESATSFSGTGTLPSLTFVSASAGSSATNLLVGGSVVFTATYAITAADITAGKVDNSAFANGLSPKNVAVKDTSDSKNPADYNETGTPSDPNGEDKTGTPIAENPKIAIVKGSALNLGTDGIATVGDIITYSYDVSNIGNVPLTGVSVVESATSFSGTGTLPSPTFVSASAGSSATNLLVGGSAVFTATYAITAADIAAGKVDNSAFANGLSPKNVAVKDTSDSKNPADYNETGTPSDPNGEDKTGTPIAENPKIAIFKGSALNLGTDGVASVGDIITYSYDVSNTGNVPLTGVSVVESATSFSGTGTLPSPTFVSASAGSSATNLLVGGSAVFTATYAITAADIAAGKVDNSAFANGLSPKNVAVKDTSDSKNPADYNETGTPSDPNGEDKTGTPIAENPKIAIVKGSALNLGTDAVASVGDIITYSYDVSNIGNVPLTGVSVVESATSFSGTGTLPSPTFVSATLSSPAGSLKVGEKAIYTATYAITAADIAAGKVDNSAFANGLSPKNVAVKDTSDSKNPTDYNETGTPSDPNGKDKTGTPIAENPKIAIVKGSALNLGTDGIATVGDIITYSYDVSNIGNVPLTGVSVVESATSFSGTGTLPSPTFVSATLSSPAGSLKVGEKAIYTATYAITAADITAGKVDNSAFANGLSPKNVAVKDTSDSKNPADYNETGTPSDPNGKDKTGTPIAENPKIAIVKGSALNLGTDGIATVGDIITYSYDVSNTGNVPLTGVSVVESATSFSGTGTLPSPTFVSASAGSSATNLLVGGSAVFTATYAITAADIAAGKVDNSAFANGLSPKNVAVKDTSDSKNPADYNETGTPSDPNGKDKTGTPIAENPKIAIVKGSTLNLGADGIATVGDIITYSYDVSNTGNVPLTGVSVVESATAFSGTGTLPSPTFVSATAGSSATNLLVGGSAVFTATYAITAADIAAGKVDNSAFANGLSPKNVAVKDTSDSKNPADYNETGTPSDPNGKDKTGTPIAENPKIAIVKGSTLNLGADGIATVGDIITYSYDVSNIGNVPLTGVSVVESATSFSGTGTLPTPTFVSATAGSSATNLLVAGKATFTANYAITAADIAAGKVDNSAFANGLSPKNVAVKDTSDSKNTADYNETGTPSDPNGKDKTGTPIAENPKIAIVKGSALNLGTDGIATVGDIITYSYDVSNIGNVPLTGVSVVESATSFNGTGTLPSPTFISASAGSSATNLLVGGSAVFTANYAITAADIAAGKVDNSAFANGLSPKNVAVRDTSDSKNPNDYNETGTPSDPNGKDRTGTPIAENPKIAIVKGSALNLGTDGIATVGDIITYSYDVTNTGNVPLTGVSVVESATSFSGTGILPTPTFVSATAGSSATNLLVAGKATFTANYAITAADITAGKVDNSAFANGLSPKNVAVKDTSDSKNTADYNETGTPSDPNGKDKTGTPIAESPKIAIVKGSALNLGTDGVASVGDIITYSYDVSNIGNVPLTGVSVVESATSFSGTGTLPSPTFVSASAGSSATNLLVAGKATFTATYAITTADIAAGKVDNSAFANGLSPKNVAVKDTSDSKNSADYNETGTPSDPNGKDKTGTPIAESPKIAIVKGSSLNLGADNVANVGDIITYSYDITNTGNVPLTNVLITESLAGFTGSGTPPTPIFVSANQGSPIGTLKVGEKATYTANYPITAADLNAGKIDNQALASGKSPKNITVTDESDSKNTGDYNETGTPSDLKGKDKTGTLLPKTVCVKICVPITIKKIR